MAGNTVVVILERMGIWARHLRPREDAMGIRLVEARLVSEMVAATRGYCCPIAVISLGREPASLTELFQGIREISASGLVLLLDEVEIDGLAEVAREGGVTHVLSGPVRPPEVMEILERWVVLARNRSEDQGWCAAVEQSGGLWDELVPSGWPRTLFGMTKS